MRKEILLSGVLLFGAGAPAMAQPEQSPEPTPIVEQERLDVSSMIEAFRQRLNYGAEPHFFRQMERRAGDADYFKITKLPDGTIYGYYPNGLTRIPKASYLHTITGGVGNDYNGVELGLNFFITEDRIDLELGKDGTLAGEDGVDLFNFRQLRRKLDEYFRQPSELKELLWTEVDSTPQNPQAVIYKQTEKPLLTMDKPKNILFGGTQRGHLVYQQRLLEIPVLGTDEGG